MKQKARKARQDILLSKFNLNGPVDTKPVHSARGVSLSGEQGQPHIISPRYRNVSIRTTQLNLKRWKNPVFRKKMVELNKKRWQNPEYYIKMQKVNQCNKEKYRQELIKRWKNPTYREKMLHLINLCWSKKSYRAKLKRRDMNNSKRFNLMWKNPKFRSRMLSSTVRKKQALSRKPSPNKSESRVLNFINSISRIKFKYVGGGKEAILINGRSPDFINKRKKIIILFHSVHWHLDVFGLTNTPQNKRKTERKDCKPFKKAGYKVLFIWDDEFDKIKYAANFLDGVKNEKSKE